MLDQPKTAFRDWRELSQQELDDNYNQNSLVPDNGPYKERKVRESEKARATLKCILDVPYGPTLKEKLDIFPAAQKGAPIQIFIHGGAWKSGNKSEVSYPAPVFHAAGANFIAVNFASVPDVMIEEQVRQCRAAIAWTYRNAASFGGDPERIFISGHSSGGHVTGMMVVTDWVGVYGLPADIIKGAAPVSGMYDLEPVRHSWRNTYLHLDEERAQALSAIHQIPATRIPLVIGVGSGELPEFQRQNHAFVDAWRAAGQDCEFLVVEGKNHFDMGAEFGDPDSPIIKAILRQMKLA
jgi:arylformamidase